MNRLLNPSPLLVDPSKESKIDPIKEETSDPQQKIKSPIVSLVEVWEFPEEAKWEVKNPKEMGYDPEVILSVWEGPFFVPDGYSRNKRFYSRKLWERVLKSEEVKKLLKERLMFGMIGHEDSPITEDKLRNGEVSHIIVDLWIDESSGLGYGRALILNNEAGYNLYVYLKAGSRLRMSSRAKGRSSGRMTSGDEIIDEDSYIFHTFDAVISAGFERALPTLKESFTKNESKEPKMNEEFLKSLTEGMDSLREELKAEKRNNSLLKKRLNENKSKTDPLKSVLEASSITPSELKMVIESIPVDILLGLARKSDEIDAKTLDIIATHPNLSETLQEYSQYKQLGEPAEISVLIERATEKLESYKSLGTPESINEMVEKYHSKLNAYSEIGNPEEIQENVESAILILEEYKEIGSPKEINETIEKASEFLEAYREIGSPAEIKSFLKEAEETFKHFKKQRVNEGVEKISKKFQAPRELVKGLLEKYSPAQTEELLKSFGKTARTPFQNERESKQSSFRPTTQGTAVSRLFESMIK